MGKVIAFMSASGGQGRSTAAVNIAYSLAKEALGEVLFIDCCSDGAATSMLSDDPSVTYDFGDVVRGACDPGDAVYPVRDGLSMMPAPADDSFLVEQSVSDLLDDVRHRFELVVVDCVGGSYSSMAEISSSADMCVVCTRADERSLACAAKLRRVLPESDRQCRLLLTAYSSKKLRRGELRGIDKSIDTVEAMLLGVIPDTEEGQKISAANVAGRIMGRHIPLMKL